MNRIRIAILLTLLSCLAVPGFAQQPSQRRVVTHTRFQIVMGNLERQWLKAVQDKDAAALNRVLSPDFEVWTPEPPGWPVPREDWQKDAFLNKLQSYEVRQLAAKTVNPQLIIADFVLHVTVERDGKPQTEDYFIADVWTGSGKDEDWRCSDRYISRIPETAAAPETKPEDVKPSGKG